MTPRLLAAAAAVVLALGCGNSKKSTPASGRTVSYSGPVAPASLTASTDKAMIAGGAVSLVAGFSEMSTSSTALAFGAGRQPGVAAVSDAIQLAADARHHPALATVAGALAQQTRPCSGGGTVTYSANDQDGNAGTTQAGDYVEVAFAACNERSAVTDGSFRVTIDTTSGADLVADVTSITTSESFGLSLAFANYFVTFADGSWSGMNGDMTIAFAADTAAGTVTYGVSGTSFEEAAYDGAVTSGLRIGARSGQTGYHDTAVEVYSGMGTPSAHVTEHRWSMDARVCSTEINGCLSLSTNPQFSQLVQYAYPSSGALTVSDDAGDWIKVEAVSATTGACTLSWSIDGATGSQSTTWSALEAAAN